jgi:hypothetical protein
MKSPIKPRLVQHDTGLWEARATLNGREVHFGFFSERDEAQRTLDAALARHGEQPAEPKES